MHVGFDEGSLEVIELADIVELSCAVELIGRIMFVITSLAKPFTSGSLQWTAAIYWD